MTDERSSPSSVSATEALAQARLAAIVESSDDAIVSKDLNGIITTWNRSAERIFGYTAADVIGRPVTILIPPDRLDEEPGILMRIRQGERIDHYETIRLRKDGRPIHVSLTVSPIYGPGGAVVGASKIAREITDRVRAEHISSRLAAIVESSDDAIVSKDLNGIITTWNRGAERIFGYTADEVIGRPVTILIPPDRLDEEPGILMRIRQGERIDHYPTVRRRKDGTSVAISLSISPILDGRGHIVGASKIARDITQERQAEEERAELLRRAQEARDAAQSANHAKDEFLAMLGHELRNPLSAVRNALSAAMLDPRTRDRAIAIARRQADQLTRIVDDLLDVARITQGRVPLRKARVALSRILTQTVDASQALMQERGHSLRLSLPAETVVISADADRLQQAFSNLLNNAAKYTDPGGTIDVTATREGEHAVIRVRDNGIGIAPELLPSIFDLFRQGERGLDRAQGGLGIGLTLVRTIVELHGGQVEARSAGIGRGTEFMVRLPSLVGAESEESARSSRQFAARQPARILMVEDNPDAAESLVMILELLGHHVRTAHDGEQALEAARANVPDVMLIDIGLPGMDGYQLASAIRSEPELRHLVLIALTGYGQPEDKNRAMAAGFDYHLTKPVDLGTIDELVGRVISPRGDTALQ